MKFPDIELKLSTLYPLQTDGETEIIKQTHEQYLNCYCSYQQVYWVNQLPLARYSYNCEIQELYKFFLFYMIYRLAPGTPRPFPKSKIDNLDQSRAFINSKRRTNSKMMSEEIQKYRGGSRDGMTKST
jgi:hypothetical protein